jgi:hypothetical protein
MHFDIILNCVLFYEAHRTWFDPGVRSRIENTPKGWVLQRAWMETGQRSENRSGGWFDSQFWPLLFQQRCLSKQQDILNKEGITALYREK